LTLGTDLPAAPAVRVHALGAFRHSNYRLYLLSTVVSQIGTWMQYLAEGLLIYRLTQAPLALGLLGFLPLLPLVPLMFLGGALADRLPRQKYLIWVQMAAVLPPLWLATLTWTGRVQVWHVILVEMLIQSLATLDKPARQALIVDTVEMQDLDAGVALSASVFNLSRVVGPALGGLLVAWAGEGVCFALNAVSFLASGIALLLLRLPSSEAAARGRSPEGGMLGGVRYLARERFLAAALGLSLLVSLFVMPYQRFLPVFALDILDVGEVGLGVLNALAGLGAVLGAIALAGVVSRWPGRRGKLAWGLALLVGPLLALFALARSAWLSGLMVMLVGAGVVAVRGLAFTLVQVYVPDELRGRTLSIVILLSVGAVRVGELAVGFLASHAGVTPPLLLAAGACLLGTAALGLLVPRLRHAP